MAYNQNIHHRRSIRLKGYDYSRAGLYFINICVQNRDCLFGEIVDDQMILNDSGKMVENEWMALRVRFPNIELHEFIVMPNHFHGILQIVDVGAPLVGAPNDTPVPNNVRAPLVGAPNDTRVPNDVRAPLVGAPNDTRVPNDVGAPNDDDINERGRPQGHAPTIHAHTIHDKTVGDILDAFKSITTVKYIHGVKQSGWEHFNGKLWQRDYWEHIIRDQTSFDAISEYIMNNPKNWNTDKLK